MQLGNAFLKAEVCQCLGLFLRADLLLRLHDVQEGLHLLKYAMHGVKRVRVDDKIHLR